MRAFAFNVALAAFELVLLVAAWRRPSVWACFGVGAAAVVAALAGAFILAEDFFGVARLGCWAAFAHGAGLLAAFSLVLRRRRALAASCAVLAAAILAAGWFAFYVEPFRLEVNTVRLASPKIRRPLRIAVLADFQAEAIGPYERSVAATLAAQKADLILLPGDYVQVMDRGIDARLRSEFRALFTEFPLTAPLGAIATRGDCEWRRDWRETFAGLPVETVEETRAFDFADLRVTALAYSASADARIEVAPADRFHLVVGHRPDFALGDVAADLLVAGHTHGGQVALPFFGPPITLSQVPRAWASGTTKLPSGATLVVSRGIGMERVHAPRLRFLCPPEIVVIELVPGA
jgi:predicted MPP superfamily phosphohydrolase